MNSTSKHKASRKKQVCMCEGNKMNDNVMSQEVLICKDSPLLKSDYRRLNTMTNLQAAPVFVETLNYFFQREHQCAGTAGNCINKKVPVKNMLSFRRCINVSG